VPEVAEWSTVAELATAVGTLVLAARTLRAAQRPALVAAEPEDSAQDVLFADELTAERRYRTCRPPRLSARGLERRSTRSEPVWQAALRDVEDPLHRATGRGDRNGGRITIDVLYGDHDGGQPPVTRIVLLPGEGDMWRADVTRHWRLDDLAPR
jgi:hypothetical protein